MLVFASLLMNITSFCYINAFLNSGVEPEDQHQKKSSKGLHNVSPMRAEISICLLHYLL